MKQIDFSTSFLVFESSAELQEQEKTLIQKAKQAADKAYADYSNFHVGCAVLLDDGSVVTGNNQENIAYPSGLCAERVAIFHARSNYPEKNIRKIALYAFSEEGHIERVITPCGACRQVMIEYEQQNDQPIEILMSGEEGRIYKTTSVESLLPFYFKTNALKRRK